MNKLKLLGGIVVVLIALNSIVLLVFLLEAKEHKQIHFSHRQTEQHKHQMVRELFSFNDEQMHRYLRSKKDHGDLIFRLSNRQLELSEAFYTVHKRDTSSNNNDKILEELSELNKDIYTANLKHLQDISMICDASQKQYLDTFINSILHKGAMFERKKLK